MSTGPDNLFDLKNSFYLGNWQQCLNEAANVKTTTDEQKLERDVFMYRAYLAQKKFNVVLSEINQSSPQPLKAVRLYARYLSSSSTSSVDEILAELDSNQTLYMDDCYSSLCAAAIYFHEKNYENVLKILNNSNDIECMAATVQALLHLDRLDLARKEHKRMCQKDEYHTLSQLALAWINLYYGGEKLQDSYFIYQELKEKFGPTPLLLNGQATALICQNRWEEAEQLIVETIEKDSNYTEAIINQMLLANLQGKSLELINRFINQLSDRQSLDQTFYNDFQMKQNEFNKIAKQYQIV
ncbi:coatomer subunit epsilon [Dermatophagoides pteronyssinus]|uniref:coatomer subunit epsilon n=1 Tax=Dermatophagoides pteronyssinus TaxID=6956 RepID=UPI003F680C52